MCVKAQPPTCQATLILAPIQSLSVHNQHSKLHKPPGSLTTIHATAQSGEHNKFVGISWPRTQKGLNSSVPHVYVQIMKRHAQKAFPIGQTLFGIQ